MYKQQGDTMSIIYCDTCGMHVESDAAGTVRTCGLESSGEFSEEDHGFANDCPFDNDLTIEDYDEDLGDEYDEDADPDWDDSDA
jgi:hypothetical protein